MNSEIAQIWQEIVVDLTTKSALWQLLVILAVLSLAALFNWHLRKQTAKGKINPLYKLLLGGIERLFFPFAAFAMLMLARYALIDYMHVGMLRLAARMLLAMVFIRLLVYVVRYVFSPSPWLQSFERIIAWSIWGVVALHLSGFLDPVLLMLEDVKFRVGKQSLNLLLLLQGALTIVVTMLVALWLSRMLELRLMAAQNISGNWRVIMVKLVRMVAIMVALLMSMAAVGIDITMLSVFGGALGVGLGFGLQKIASNYVSGFIILMDKSMHLGDMVTISNHYGVVSELRSRYMVLRKADGTEVIIPNETMITDVVINHTASIHKGKAILLVQISYDSDLDMAMQILKEAADQHTRVMDIPVEVTIIGLVDNGIQLQLTFWIADPEHGGAQVQSEVYYQIWQRFKASQFVIQYPQREVRMLA